MKVNVLWSFVDAAVKKQKMPANSCLLPEYEIESDTEFLPPEKPEKSEDEKMKEYHQFMKSDVAPGELQDVSIEDLDSMKNDKVFNKFRKRINHNPEQVSLQSVDMYVHHVKLSSFEFLLQANFFIH